MSPPPFPGAQPPCLPRIEDWHAVYRDSDRTVERCGLRARLHDRRERNFPSVQASEVLREWHLWFVAVMPFIIACFDWIPKVLNNA